jgi:hypothetical protein
MTDTKPTGRSTEFNLPTKNLPAPQVRDLPDPPSQAWRIVGPGMVGAGVGLASGESSSGPTSPPRSAWSSSGARSSA